MTPQEHIRRIKIHIEVHSRKEPRAVLITESLEKAIEALEKQVPKKPRNEGLADRLCPVCNAYIPYDALNDDVSEAPNYCDCCGQAFDWRKSVEDGEDWRKM